MSQTLIKTITYNVTPQTRNNGGRNKKGQTKTITYKNCYSVTGAFLKSGHEGSLRPQSKPLRHGGDRSIDAEREPRRREP